MIRTKKHQKLLLVMKFAQRKKRRGGSVQMGAEVQTKLHQSQYTKKKKRLLSKQMQKRKNPRSESCTWNYHSGRDQGNRNGAGARTQEANVGIRWFQ